MQSNLSEVLKRFIIPLILVSSMLADKIITPIAEEICFNRGYEDFLQAINGWPCERHFPGIVTLFYIVKSIFNRRLYAVFVV